MDSEMQYYSKQEIYIFFLFSRVFCKKAYEIKRFKNKKRDKIMFCQLLVCLTFKFKGSLARIK